MPLYLSRQIDLDNTDLFQKEKEKTPIRIKVLHSVQTDLPQRNVT